jgi:type I restriction enzyme S subunit
MNHKIGMPQLRFPSFDSQWESKKVGELCDSIVPGRNKPTNFEGDIPWITTPDIEHNGIINHSKKGLNISREEAKKVGSKIVPINSIIISCVGELGLSAIAGKEIIINQQLHAFIPKERIEYRFLLYQLNLKQKYMDKVATKTAVPYMNKDNCNSIPIDFPTLPEQQKIASFLSVVDEKIQQLSRKKELLEQYKKGLMQQLFSSKLRFKDENGKDYADWEEKRVGDFLKESRIKGGTGDSAQKLTVKLWGKGVFQKRDVTEGSAQTQYFIRKAGQFIYSKLDFLNCAFGIIPKELDGLQSTVDLPCFDLNSNINPYFLLEKVKQKNFYKQFGDTADGSRKAKRIHADIFCSFLINTPSLPEQNRIATFLSSINTKIESTNQQINQTQSFKKGLLQQMFV